VRRVGGEAALRVEGGVEPREHPVEGVGQLLELVVRPLQGDPLVQGALGQALGGRGDPLQRAQHPPRHDPAEPQRQQRHKAEHQQHRLQERAHRRGHEGGPQRVDLAAGDEIAAVGIRRGLGQAGRRRLAAAPLRAQDEVGDELQSTAATPPLVDGPSRWPSSR
jgi:hypothetical protein